MGTEHWCRCKMCKSDFPEQRLESYELHIATILDPAEFVGVCPECGAVDDGLGSVIVDYTKAFCCYCCKVPVPDVGDICPECQADKEDYEVQI